MPIIRNPRTGESFTHSDIKCDICFGLNSYLYEIFNIRFCKGCLTDMIREIDEAIIDDIKSAKIQEK